jgi:regulator of RNase E activity RraB
MDLLDVLVKQGDVLTVAREVDHWILFGSESSRSLFRGAANAAGFTIADESKVESEPTFVIKVTRKQPIDQNSIDKTVIELLNLSRKFGGDYDGWETPVVTQ